MSIQFPFLAGVTLNDQNAVLLGNLESGKYRKVLTSQTAQDLLSTTGVLSETTQKAWKQRLLQYIQDSTEDSSRQALLLIGLAALQAFLQSNVTGPPLDWKPAEICLPEDSHRDRDALRAIRKSLISDLSVDGESAYQLTPNVELFYVALLTLNDERITGHGGLKWARVRINFWHQRMLSEVAASLQGLVYEDLAYLEGTILGSTEYDDGAKAIFLLERATINTFYGFDKKAREDLEEAARLRGFNYKLTGRLGKRTKFQQQEITQLVVLAKSRDKSDGSSMQTNGAHGNSIEAQSNTDKPANLDLNDDTLLEAIAFSKPKPDQEDHEEDLPQALASLDPANQPLLESLDSILLLSFASSVTNTSPEHGLTREETLPYATRVLDGGSSNWQVYTQALLVRSRIEGYRTRTVERAVLQLQALVDQVIAETTGESKDGVDGQQFHESEVAATTFLPRAKSDECAPVQERLLYINQLASPPRWSLEAELAQRWVSLGGLRTALEIYERLEMWAEAALCWAATDREDRALRLVRKQLYEVGDTDTGDSAVENEESVRQHNGPEKTSLPADAPRLFCILGDLERRVDHYERAWEVSGQRYARAQRSIGKHYLTSGELVKSEEAYSKSLKANPQNAATWFTLGCVRLEMRDWKGAVNAFSRTVSSDPDDGEAWSNMAAALLRLPAEETVEEVSIQTDEDPAESQPKVDPQRHIKEAFVAFKRAATLKRDSYRIWQNVLNVAATISPPPYADVIVAQQRLIELRSATEGEGCIDIEIMEGILAHILATTPPHGGRSEDLEDDPTNPGQQRRRYGLERTFTELVKNKITPLITWSRRLWQMVARLSIHLNRPDSALKAYEAAWRLTLKKPGWDDGSSVGTSADAASPSETPEQVWEEVVDATIELIDAYESLGEREDTEGLAAGSGKLVCKNWKFSGKSAVRSVIGRRKKAGLEGMEILEARMEDLKGGS